MEKYDLLPRQLLLEGIITGKDLFSPAQLKQQHITAVHSISYWEKLKNQTLDAREIRRTGFPFSKQLVKRETCIAQGTIEAALHALQFGIAFNAAGGTHHAGRDFGEGFCLLNDIAIAARYLQSWKMAGKILIIDLDVHQGNGTAQIFEQDPQVVTFSMHGANNFPLKKNYSDLDIPLNDGTGDVEYLDQLEKALLGFCHGASVDFVFYQAGVDVLKSDTLGRLNLTLDGCKQRDRMVFDFCRERKLPLAVVMGGGYSPGIKTIIEAHANTYRLAQKLF